MFFSNDTEDFGHTDLVTMDIETGEILPISQKPYNISLKHTTWVQNELETLKKAGIIVFLGQSHHGCPRNELNLENPQTEGCALDY